MGYLIKTKELGEMRQEPEEVTPENGENFKLKELYDMLDCDTIEHIYLSPCQYMIIDENGKLNDSDYNDLATYYFRKAHPQNHDFIVGNALICSSKEFV